MNGRPAWLPRSLEPRTYRLLDLATKLVALVLVAGALGGAFGGLAPVAGFVGVVAGLLTVFVTPRAE